MGPLSLPVLTIKRVNFVRQSESLGTAPWAAQATAPTVTNNFGPSPAPTTTSTRIVFASGDANSRQAMVTTEMLDPGPYTASIYARSTSGGADQLFRLSINDGTTSLLSGDLTATSAWRRFEYTTPTAARGNYSLHVRNGVNALANDIEVSGAQLNPGSVADPYIPTTTVSVTRYS